MKTNYSEKLAVQGSKGKFAVLISTASWEERFVLGSIQNLENFEVERVILLRYDEWAKVTREASERMVKLCNARDVPLYPVTLLYEQPEKSWLNLKEAFRHKIQPKSKVLVDISTMPREAIWTVFFLLQGLEAEITYVYHRPESYAGDWLSRDPKKPRLLIQMSGEIAFAKPTALVIATGFDTSRTEQMISLFEPPLTLLAVQAGEQYQNREQNIHAHEVMLEKVRDQLGPMLRSRREVRSFEIDAYDRSRGFDILLKEVAPLLDGFNVLMTSLGPKLSAVGVYQLHRRYPEIGLVYAPARQYNKAYSSGIGTSHLGEI